MLSRAYSSFILTPTALACASHTPSVTVLILLAGVNTCQADLTSHEKKRQHSPLQSSTPTPKTRGVCSQLPSAYAPNSASGIQRARRCFASVNGDELDLQVEGGVWGDQPGKTLLSIRQLAWHLEARLLTQAEP